MCTKICETNGACHVRPGMSKFKVLVNIYFTEISMPTSLLAECNPLSTLKPPCTATFELHDSVPQILNHSRNSILDKLTSTRQKHWHALASHSSDESDLGTTVSDNVSHGEKLLVIENRYLPEYVIVDADLCSSK